MLFLAAQALEEQVEAELQAERAAAEAEADRVKAAIEAKRREREEVEAAVRTAVRAFVLLPPAPGPSLTCYVVLPARARLLMLRI